MEKNLHNIDELFKNGLDSHEEELTAQTWDNISHKLDLKEKEALEKDNKRLRRVVFWLAAACISGLIVMAVNWERSTQNDPTLVKSNTTQPRSEKRTEAQDQKTLRSANGKGNLNDTEQNAAEQANDIASKEIKEDQQPSHSIVPFPKKNRQNEGIAQKDENKGLNQAVTHNNLSTRKNKLVSSNKISNEQLSLTSGVVVVNGKNNKAIKVQDKQKTTTSSKNKFNNLLNSSEEAIANESDYASLKVRSIDLLSKDAIQATSSNTGITFNNAKATPIKLKISRKGSWDLALQYGQTKIQEYVEEGIKEHREDDKDEIKRTQIDQPKSWNVLATVSYRLKNGLFFSSGVGYSSQDRTIQPKPIFARRPRMGQPAPPGSNDEYKFKFNCTAGYALIDPKSASPVNNGDSIISFASKSTLNYVTIPVGVGYEFKVGKMQLFAQTMIQTNILASTNLETNLEFSSGSIQKKDVDIIGLKKVYFSGILGAGIAYELVPRTSIYLMPQAGFSFGAITKDAPTSTSTSGLSWQTGIKFSL